MPRVERWLGCVLLLAVAMHALALPPTLERLLPALSPVQRDQLLARDAAWHALSPTQQQALRQRLARWHALPAATQRQRREQWQAWQALPPQAQTQVHAAATAFAALPVDEQRQWRQRFAALDRSERRGWMLGPALGADYMRLQPLLAQVPPDERAPLLARLQEMTAAERNDLALLAQRTAPQQRDALRRGLLATSSANRAEWLQSQLAR
jgi:hypothetical protein